MNTEQTSRGKTLGFRCEDAGFIKRSPVANGRLNGHVPTGLNYVTPYIQFLFVAPQFRAVSTFLSIGLMAVPGSGISIIR